MRVFIDSSSLAKRYILERGSDRVEEIFAKATQTAISLIAPLELISALSRLRRQDLISNDQYGLVKEALFKDIEDMTICNLTVDVIKKTIRLLETHPLRTLDAIQVASALEWTAELFVSSDRRQLSAAIESGLRIRSV